MGWTEEIIAEEMILRTYAPEREVRRWVATICGFFNRTTSREQVIGTMEFLLRSEGWPERVSLPAGVPPRAAWATRVA